MSLAGNITRLAVGIKNAHASEQHNGKVQVFDYGVASPAAPSPAAGAPNSVAASCSSSGDSRATGGTVTTVGEYTIHTFTSSGTFQVTSVGLTSVELLVVGGGGSGTGMGNGGGGGAVVYDDDKAVTTQSYTVTVGDGGEGRFGHSDGGTYTETYPGQDSTFGDLVAAGGMGGDPCPNSDCSNTRGGSSGGGQLGGFYYQPAQSSAGTGGGGGGAGGAGIDGTMMGGAHGGPGIQSNISGAVTFYGGGGGGGGISAENPGDGGAGGGGDGVSAYGEFPKDGAANTGGGGGGGTVGTSTPIY